MTLTNNTDKSKTRMGAAILCRPKKLSNRTGRPKKIIPLAVLPKAEEIISDITFLVDKVMSWLHNASVPTINEIEQSMKDRLFHECARLQEAAGEMAKLAAAYNRFVDLRDEQVRRERRVSRILAVLGDSVIPAIANHDGAARLNALKVSTKEIREEVPLWEAMKEYLLHVPEARITEMEDYFACFKFPAANRQAMESAIKRHPQAFKVRKSKREKFISLKDKAKD